MSERGGGSGFGSFLLGIAVGAVVGFLFAPEAGDDTRRKLSKRLRNLRDAAGEKVDEVRGLLESDESDEADDGEGEEEEEEEVSTREQLRRRLDAARRRRRRGEEAPVQMEEEEEPLA
ncbi:MAG TPA: YtxH domain-containing protein [Gemmatimonadales bacterium]|nr:YtxH domain-containing protein [Gemmatimonadales bacterium]